MGAHRSKGGVRKEVVSFLVSSQCIASAAFVFMYVICIHLALSYTEDLKVLQNSNQVSLAEVHSDLSGFLESGPQKQGQKVHKVKSEELRAALGDLQGLHRKVRLNLPEWAQALKFSFERGEKASILQQMEPQPEHSQGLTETGGNVDVSEIAGSVNGRVSSASVDLWGGAGGAQEESEGGAQEQGEDPPAVSEDGIDELRPEDVVNVEQIVEDMVAQERTHAEEEIKGTGAHPKQDHGDLEPLPEDTMDGILEETALFIEERAKSLARLSSYEPIDENLPESEFVDDSLPESEVLEKGKQEREDSRAMGVWTIGDPSFEPSTDLPQPDAQQSRKRHLLGFDSVPFPASTPPCAHDNVSPFDPFGFMQASIQQAFDTGTGLIPGPSTSFDCEMTFDGQGQRCVDRDTVVSYPPEDGARPRGVAAA